MTSEFEESLPSEFRDSDFNWCPPDDDEDTREAIERRVPPRRSQQWTPHFKEQCDDGVSLFQFTIAVNEHKYSAQVGLEYLKHGTGSSVWDSSVALMAYMENPRYFPVGYWVGKNVLELGAGAGIVGILAGVQGASRVVLTDLACLLPFLSANIELNRAALTVAESDVQAFELDWCQPIAPQLKQMTFDVILCADCLMSPEVWELLSAVLLQLLLRPARRDPPLVLLAYENRFDTSRFFEILKNLGPTLEEVSMEDMHPGFSSTKIHLYRVFPPRNLARALEHAEKCPSCALWS